MSVLYCWPVVYLLETHIHGSKHESQVCCGTHLMRVQIYFYWTVSINWSLYRFPPSAPPPVQTLDAIRALHKKYHWKSVLPMDPLPCEPANLKAGTHIWFAIIWHLDIWISVFDETVASCRRGQGLEAIEKGDDMVFQHKPGDSTPIADALLDALLCYSQGCQGRTTDISCGMGETKI